VRLLWLFDNRTDILRMNHLFFSKLSPVLMRLIVGFATLAATAGFIPAQSAETVLYRFKGGTDGFSPTGGLIFDGKGALYGTTESGGGSYGTVFKLTPPAASQMQWTETVLYRFKGGNDGASPGGSPIFDDKGALYGTTGSGGESYGTVFKLTPPYAGQTQWTETVLYRFKGGNDGVYPGDLIFDGKGALYGTTFNGGEGIGGEGFGYGTVFKLTPPIAGQSPWSKTMLYLFKGRDDGAFPRGLIFDSKGSLYGTTYGGGGGPDTGTVFSSGTVFKLMPPSGLRPQWAKTVLYRFKGGTDGTSPTGGLIFDGIGALYGTTFDGGISAGPYQRVDEVASA
jgi:hypothetical protein